jgi:hypothetical protein
MRIDRSNLVAFLLRAAPVVTDVATSAGNALERCPLGSGK